ncbi:hypothetical protein, partial [Nocardia brasiliensis]|uniref:hypothetical protein n=1 Tax=Nocardia brasiliensis TaxID=37326 RepID=UPI0024541192
MVPVLERCGWSAWGSDLVGWGGGGAAPASSLSAARGLAGRWRGTGRHDTALWGLCQGSGAKPY